MRNLYKILLLIPILVFNSCEIKTKKQSIPLIVADTIVYQLIYDIVYSDTSGENGFVDPKLYAEMMTPSLSIEDSSMIEKLDTLFNTEDHIFIISQIRQQDSLKLNPKKISGIKLIPNDSLTKWSRSKKDFWECYYQNYQRGFNTIGFPYFSKDLKKCVVRIGYGCGGLCGGSRTVIYLKRNDKWVVYKILSFIIS
jgi:hypothetical protein